MTGIALAKRAHELRPDLKIVLASGYARLPEDLGVPVERMDKPYQERDLAAVIARLYAGQP